MQIDWKIKDNVAPQGMEDFWYDLTDGGYLDPEKFLADNKQIKKLNDAVELVESFQHMLVEKRLVDIM